MEKKFRPKTSAFGGIADARQLGLYGENLACNNLIQRGFRIAARNWRTRYGEIDIIANIGSEYCFSEVKTRRASIQGSPEDAIVTSKLKRMRTTAELWLSNQKITPSIVHVNVFAITLMRNGHIEMKMFEE